MTYEITFSVAIEVNSEDIRSIREQFENMTLFHPSVKQICQFSHIEQVIRIDDCSCDDFTFEYKHAYDKL